MTEFGKKCRALYHGNYEIVRESMGKASGGDADGAFFIFDELIMVDINLKESFPYDLRKQERLFGVFYSDNRICPSDCIVVSRPDGAAFRPIPLFSNDLHEKVKEKLLTLKEQGRLIGFRWNEGECVSFENAYLRAKESFTFTYMPMFKQYFEFKKKHPDAIMLFRCGDFYETYDDDAVEASEILGITLTKSTKTCVRMVGFPYHALDTYLQKLIRAGKRVAICDQLEDPKLTKKLVKRGITEIVSG